MKNDDRPLLGLQPLECVIEQFAVGDRGGHVGDGRCVHRQQLHLDRPPTTPAHHVDAGAEDEAVEPGLEAIGIAEAGQVPPRGEEAFLDRVSGELVVPKDEAGRGIQAPDERDGKVGKGVMIASPSPLDELSLVHGHPR